MRSFYVGSTRINVSRKNRYAWIDGKRFAVNLSFFRNRPRLQVLWGDTPDRDYYGHVVEVGYRTSITGNRWVCLHRTFA